MPSPTGRAWHRARRLALAAGQVVTARCAHACGGETRANFCALFKHQYLCRQPPTRVAAIYAHYLYPHPRRALLSVLSFICYLLALAVLA
jgi:hypothetical protein